MAWESRERGGPYYTRSKRVNGQVVREYIGGGELARIVAGQDAINRSIREAKQKWEQEELDRLAALGDPLGELCEVTEILARAHLLADGYHEHKGEWRRERSA
jgi:hypothetical protein